MSARSSVAGGWADAAGMPQELDGILRELIAEHEILLGVTIEHRRAIASADLNALNACIIRQNETVQRIAAIEGRRASLVASVAAGAAPGAVPLMTITALASRASEPAKSRLISLAAKLRELLNTLHREHMALRIAAETLASHMDGLVRQVYRQLSHAGTYARTGAVDASVRVVSSLDVKT